jgi:predicted site-specific integrase-resolvase
MAHRSDKNLRAGLYARVSTEDRGQDPETQLRPLREYADRRGFAVAGEFVDRASGTTEQRPQYQKLLEAARKRELDVIPGPTHAGPTHAGPTHEIRRLNLGGLTG